MKLECGCCGNRFRGLQKRSHDKGYGLCPRCQKLEDEDNARRWDQLRDKVAAALNPTNSAKFLAMEPDLQRCMMLEMMDAGFITFSVRRRSLQDQTSQTAPKSI